MPHDPKQQLPRPSLSEPHLPLTRYRLVFRAQEPFALPPFQGAVWRSVFGNALKAMSERAAALGQPDRAELYRYFFETPPPPDAPKMRLYETAPHPYVIAAEPNFEPHDVARGAHVLVELTLIGSSNDAVDAVFEAFALAAAAGLGKSRGRAELVEAHPIWRDDLPESGQAGTETRRWIAASAESPAVPPMPEAVEVHLISPLRLTAENRLVGPDAFRPGNLLRALIRRVSMLMTFHTGSDLETDFRRLTALASQARMAEPALAFSLQERWSTNKSAVITMDGLMGHFLLDMRGLEPLWPYLWLGQWVHAGKGTVMGLGAIHVREAVDF
jgi:hypothetical protein